MDGRVEELEQAVRDLRTDLIAATEMLNTVVTAARAAGHPVDERVSAAVASFNATIERTGK